MGFPAARRRNFTEITYNGEPIFPDPNAIGQSEYRAIFDLVQDAYDSWLDDLLGGPTNNWTDYDVLIEIIGLLEEIESWTVQLKRTCLAKQNEIAQEKR